MRKLSRYLPCCLPATKPYIATHICVLNQHVVLILWFEIGLLLFGSQDVLHLSNHAIQRPSKVKYQVAILKRGPSQRACLYQGCHHLLLKTPCRPICSPQAPRTKRGHYSSHRYPGSLNICNQVTCPAPSRIALHSDLWEISPSPHPLRRR